MSRTLATDTPKKLGKKVTLKGWVDAKRDHGNLIFIDLRDRSGLVQLVGAKDLKQLKPESVIEVLGVVRQRSNDNINHELPTGAVEIAVDSVSVLNPSATLPFPIDTDGYEIDEEKRLKYRYLDLRRKRVHQNIKDRSRFVQAAREYLFQHDFIEIETPILTKSTKEGSRDFVVPSRLQPGKFFALPQSPQQYKQLLMVAGFERYFQIARCLRDEDPRADRGYEHTQIDMEMSFVNREDVMKITEGMIVHAIEALGGTIAKKPFPVITYQEAMNRYGADRFDPRTQKEKDAGLLSFVWVVDFPFFKQVDQDDAAEVADGKSGWTFTHNPFSMPKPEHIEWHLAGKNIDQILTTQYDLVCNGYEVGGGSIRAHRADILKATYKIMGYSETEIEAQVGHMLKAFSFGTPPHGGIAPGVERLIMILKHEDYLREVQAFPQTGKGNTSVMEAPSPITPKQLAELGLSLRRDADSTDLYQVIKNELADRGIKYQEYRHAAVFTSQDAAEARGDVDLSQGAKAMVLKKKNDHFLFVLPGNERIDLKALRKKLGSSQYKLANLDSIVKITGVEAGAVPPFGSLMGLKTYVDARLLKNREIVFNAGHHQKSFKISLKDYLSIEQPQIVDLS